MSKQVWLEIAPCPEDGAPAYRVTFFNINGQQHRFYASLTDARAFADAKAGKRGAVVEDLRSMLVVAHADA